MVYKYQITWCITLLYATQIFAYKEIIGIIEQATDLNAEELNLLRPLFKHFQVQYDYIASRPSKERLDADPQFMTLYKDVKTDFEKQFESLLQRQQSMAIVDNNNNNNNNTFKYNATLPSVSELIGDVGIDLTGEELAERIDIEALLEDTLNDAQTQINEIAGRSLQLQSQLIKINKHKLVGYIYKALTVLYGMAARVSRAAYCTYSYIPQLNATLQRIYDGVDCYNYTKHLVLRVEEETVRTVKIMRKNVFSLANVYKKIAAKKSLLGKLSAVLLNLPKIAINIGEAYRTGNGAIDKLQNELPNAVNKTLICGRAFGDGVPEMIEIAANLTTCITFSDDTATSKGYDFIEAEFEHDFM